MPDKQEFQEILDCGLDKLIEKHGTHGVIEAMLLHVMTECGLSRSSAIVFITPSEQPMSNRSATGR